MNEYDLNEMRNEQGSMSMWREQLIDFLEKFLNMVVGARCLLQQ